MTALSAARNDKEFITGSDDTPYYGKLAASAVMFDGAMAMMNSSGYLLVPASSAANQGVRGVVDMAATILVDQPGSTTLSDTEIKDGKVDNTTGANGAKACVVRRGIWEMKCVGATINWTGRICYAADDQTVQLGAGSNLPKAGVVWKYNSATSVFVEVGKFDEA